jgi:hypothetical protein
MIPSSKSVLTAVLVPAAVFTRFSKNEREPRRVIFGNQLTPPNLTRLGGNRTRHLPGAIDLDQHFTAGNEFAQDREKESLAETADRRLWLKMEGAALATSRPILLRKTRRGLASNPR